MNIMEFIIIVESEADFRMAAKLAERVLLEKIEWLETDLFARSCIIDKATFY